MSKHTPLQLSPDYIPIERQVVIEPIRYQKGMNPKKKRFIDFHSKGDKVKGHEKYIAFYDKTRAEADEIMVICKRNRQMITFSTYLGLAADTVVKLHNRKEIGRRDYRRLLSMHKIVKRFDTFLESRNGR